MPQVDPEIVEKVFKVFVLFDAISVKFPRVFVICSKTIKNERMSFVLRVLRRTLHRLASKTLQNDSK